MLWTNFRRYVSIYLLNDTFSKETGDFFTVGTSVRDNGPDGMPTDVLYKRCTLKCVLAGKRKPLTGKRMENKSKSTDCRARINLYLRHGALTLGTCDLGHNHLPTSEICFSIKKI